MAAPGPSTPPHRRVQAPPSPRGRPSVDFFFVFQCLGARRWRTSMSRVDLKVPQGAPDRNLCDATLRFDLALGVRRRHGPKCCKKKQFSAPPASSYATTRALRACARGRADACVYECMRPSPCPAARPHARKHARTQAPTHPPTPARTHARTRARMHPRTDARSHAPTRPRANVPIHTPRMHAHTHAATRPRTHTPTNAIGSRTCAHVCSHILNMCAFMRMAMLDGIPGP